MNELVYLLAYGISALVGLFFIVVLPIMRFIKGKREGSRLKSVGKSMILGGVIFFVTMLLMATLESTIWNADSGVEGVIPMAFSFLGIISFIIGIILKRFSQKDTPNESRPNDM